MIWLCDVILRADQHARGPLPPVRVLIEAAGHLDDEVCAPVDGCGVLAHDVVEAEVELVVGECLGRLVEGLSCWVAVRILIVDLERGEERVVKADVDCADGVDDRIGLVRFEGRGDGQVGCGIAVEDVDEFGLLHGCDHHGASLGIRCEELTGSRPPRAGAAKGLRVDHVEHILHGVVLEDGDLARI